MRRLVAAGLAVALAPLGGCRSVSELRIPVQDPAALRLEGEEALEIAEVQVPALGSFDVAGEIRRYLESELRNAGIPLRASPDGEAAGRRLLVNIKGRLEETTVGRLDTQPGESVPEPSRVLEPVHRTRWMRGYRLDLVLEIEDGGGREVLWRSAVRNEKPPAERSGRLFALYELMEPAAKELVEALKGRRDREPRSLFVP